MKISICIPTYNRPDMLQEALNSCFSQTLKPYEILIGDDSTNVQTEKLIEKIKNSQKDITIRYFHNEPSLGQYKNVNKLFMQSEGEFISLLHDDDLYEEDALDVLADYFQKYKNVDAVFGKQSLISEDEEENAQHNDEHNKAFYRTEGNAGRIQNKLMSAVIQQFPNNGYLVRSELAKRVGYLEAGNAEDACDYFFSILLAEASIGEYYFLNRYVSKYRLTSNAVSNNEMNNAAFNSYRILMGLIEKDKIDVNGKLQKLIREKSYIAIVQAAKLKRTKQGFQWFFSKYNINNIFSFQGIYTFFKLILSGLK